MPLVPAGPRATWRPDGDATGTPGPTPRWCSWRPRSNGRSRAAPLRATAQAASCAGLGCPRSLCWAPRARRAGVILPLRCPANKAAPAALRYQGAGGLVVVWRNSRPVLRPRHPPPPTFCGARSRVGVSDCARVTVRRCACLSACARRAVAAGTRHTPPWSARARARSRCWGACGRTTATRAASSHHTTSITTPPRARRGPPSPVRFFPDCQRLPSPLKCSCISNQA